MSVELIVLIILVVMLLVQWWQQQQQTRKLDVLHGRADEQSKQFEALRNTVENNIGKMTDTVKALEQDLKTTSTQTREAQLKQIYELHQGLSKDFNTFSTHLGEVLNKNNEALLKNQLDASKSMHETLTNNARDMSEQIAKALKNYGEEFGKRVEMLTDKTDGRLKEISGQVEQRLGEGFEKTTETFANVLKRLTLIDEAQKKITELSGNVVSLQEVLADKRSRGAFGEVQLSALVGNIMPASSYKLQYTLSNNTRVDCMLFLPDPTGNIAVDSKFPLESFHKMTAFDVLESERVTAERQFRADIKKHINDIADKYIIKNETADGAVMFIPAEAVFAEIHAHFPELVEESQRKRVWMVSPTTLMAVLTTARAVIKDDATRKQVHLIQDHLAILSQDFQRFRKRMDNLSKHIQQANKDVGEVTISAEKINKRFDQIEKVELEDETENADLLPSE